jgi:hypothetical protein
MDLSVRRPRVAVVLAALAIIDLAVLAFLVFGIQGSLRLGPVRIRIHEFENPFYIGLALSTCLAILQWRERPWRRFALGLTACFVLLALANLVHTAPAFKMQGDLAVGELYVLLAAKRHLLVGPYSRFHWHHPGPLYFFLQTPLYAMSGYQSAALYAGAVAINLAALATLAWVAAREDRGVLAVSITLASIWFTWRPAGLLASPWTAHIPVVSSLTFLVTVSALAAGRLRLLPLVVLFGSFILQTHVAYVPLVLVLGVGAFISSLYLRWRDKAGPPWPVVNASAWLLAALWLLPIVEQISHTPGNATSLWKFFVADRSAGQPLGMSIAYWSHALLGSLEPVLRLPWGVPAEQGGAWTVSAAVVSVSLLPLAAVAAFRARRRFETSIATAAFVASLVGLWSITRIRQDVLQHDIIWLSGFGAVNLAIISTAAIRAARDIWLPRRTVSSLAVTPVPVAVACTLSVLFAVSIGLRDFHGLVDYEATKYRALATVEAADSSIRRYLATDRVSKPIFQIKGDWGLAASTFVELEKAGVAFAIEDPWLFMFTDAYASTGREDAVVTLSGFRLHRALSDRPRNVVVLEDRLMSADAVAMADSR